MYNINRRKSVFKKNIVGKLGKSSTGLTEAVPEYNVGTKEIIECSTVTTSNNGLTGNQTINGVTTTDGTIVLVQAQTDPKLNGVYVANSSTWYPIANNLNEISLITILSGDFQGYGYSLINKPVDFGDDDVNFIQLWNNDENQTSVSSATIPFTHTTLNGATIGYVELLSGTSGKLLDIISLNMEITLTSASTTGDLNLGFESGSDELFYIANSILNGTGTAYYKFMQTYITESINYAIDEGFGIYFNPAFAVSSGSITGSFYLTYRLI